MRMKVFANRVMKEILRDPLTMFFGILFPVILLLLLSLINSNIPAQEGAISLFRLESLAPGVASFGLSFMALFAGQILSKDRCSSLLSRLFTTPMTSSDFIFGYTLPLVPMALCQGIICYAVSLLLGLEFTPWIFLALAALLPAALVFISLGLICGTLLNDKQVGGICGALLTNLSAWLSGIWFDTAMVGGVFDKLADLLPFSHSVELGRAALKGDLAGMLPHLWVVLGYGVLLYALAVFLFRFKMKRD